MRAASILVAILALAPAAIVPAVAAAPAEAQKDGHVDVSPFAVPVTAGGKVVNYVFVSLRLHAASGTDLPALKAKEPHIREALVRAAHRVPLHAPDQRSVLDEARLAAVGLAEGRRIAGAKAFTRAEVRRQTPQRRMADATPR